MPTSQPRTLDEWRAYVESLSPEALWAKATAANSLGFVQTLQEEGYAGAEIEALFVLVARRLKAVGLTPPRTGYFDHASLAKEAPPSL